MLDHLNCRRHRVDIGRNPDQINRTVAALADVALEITSSDVRHDGDLQIGVVVPYDAVNILIGRELPFSELLRIKQILRCAVTDFHIIDTGCQIRLIQLAHELIREEKVVHQSTVPHRAVQNRNVRTEIH